MTRFKRILLKLSGESLAGAQKHGIDTDRLNEYALQIKEIAGMGVEIGIVDAVGLLGINGKGIGIPDLPVVV